MKLLTSSFSPSGKVGTLSPKERCIGALSLHENCIGGTLSPHVRCVDALYPTSNCVGGVLMEKSEALRPFSKVNEVEDRPYLLGEVEFGS